MEPIIESITPYKYFAAFGLVVYVDYKVANIASHVESHLKNTPHRMTPQQRSIISQKVHSLEGVRRTPRDTDDEHFPYPTSPIPSIPELGKVVKCFSCDLCREVGQQYFCRGEKQMRDHCREDRLPPAHGWVNPQTRGRRSKYSIKPKPWSGGVTCQKFFDRTMACKFFEVVEHSARPSTPPSYQLPIRSSPITPRKGIAAVIAAIDTILADTISDIDITEDNRNILNL